MAVKPGKLLAGEALLQIHSNVDRSLPKTGSKEFSPTNSWLEKKLIQSTLDERKELIEEERVEKWGSLAEATWSSTMKLAEVTRRTGKHFQTMGFEKGGKIYLYPEEALYLLETNSLELTHCGVPMSIQQGYATLLGPGTGCTVNEYRSYAHLTRQGYRVLRFSNQDGPTRYERCIRLDQHAPQKRQHPSRTVLEGSSQHINQKTTTSLSASQKSTEERIETALVKLKEENNETHKTNTTSSTLPPLYVPKQEEFEVTLAESAERIATDEDMEQNEQRMVETECKIPVMEKKSDEQKMDMKCSSEDCSEGRVVNQSGGIDNNESLSPQEESAEGQALGLAQTLVDMGSSLFKEELPTNDTPDQNIDTTLKNKIMHLLGSHFEGTISHARLTEVAAEAAKAIVSHVMVNEQSTGFNMATPKKLKEKVKNDNDCSESVESMVKNVRTPEANDASKSLSTEDCTEPSQEFLEHGETQLADKGKLITDSCAANLQESSTCSISIGKESSQTPSEELSQSVFVREELDETDEREGRMKDVQPPCHQVEETANPQEEYPRDANKKTVEQDTTVDTNIPQDENMTVEQDSTTDKDQPQNERMIVEQDTEGDGDRPQDEIMVNEKTSKTNPNQHAGLSSSGDHENINHEDTEICDASSESSIEELNFRPDNKPSQVGIPYSKKRSCSPKFSKAATKKAKFAKVSDCEVEILDVVKEKNVELIDLSDDDVLEEINHDCKQKMTAEKKSDPTIEVVDIGNTSESSSNDSDSESEDDSSDSSEDKISRRSRIDIFNTLVNMYSVPEVTVIAPKPDLLPIGVKPQRLVYKFNRRGLSVGTVQISRREHLNQEIDNHRVPFQWNQAPQSCEQQDMVSRQEVCYPIPQINPVAAVQAIAQLVLPIFGIPPTFTNVFPQQQQSMWQQGVSPWFREQPQWRGTQRRPWSNYRRPWRGQNRARGHYPRSFPTVRPHFPRRRPQRNMRNVGSGSSHPFRADFRTQTTYGNQDSFISQKHQRNLKRELDKEDQLKRVQQGRYFVPPRKYRHMQSLLHGAKSQLQEHSTDSESETDEEKDVVEMIEVEGMWMKQESRKEVHPLLKREQCTSFDSVMASLQVIGQADLHAVHGQQSCRSLRINYDIFLPGVPFKKSSPPAPNYHLCVLSVNEAVPSPGEIAFLQNSGEAPLLFAVVHPDNISFFHFSKVDIPIQPFSS